MKYFSSKKNLRPVLAGGISHTGLHGSNQRSSLPCQALWTDLKGAASNKPAHNQYTPIGLKIKVDNTMLLMGSEENSERIKSTETKEK